jgi:hypothetical protein
MSLNVNFRYSKPELTFDKQLSIQSRFELSLLLLFSQIMAPEHTIFHRTRTFDGRS